MVRALDLRTDEQISEDRECARRWGRPCKLYPGCECSEHRMTGECVHKQGLFYDDG